ncbi:uncharacterized protein LOC123693995 isoform X1 [Colias croceus]|uniref:uncharacterized protein LOC123693995 isoform X1 n=1 Tax=Colias crocea TaxID=72248 RepID=UPI001E27B0A4|nr:uncharacterized protein LOC123693995 isoform X1 [Colias croceus]
MEITIIKWIQKIGLWLGPTGNEIHWLTKICISCFFLANVAQMIALFLAKNDPEKLFGCFSVLSFCGMGFIKLYSMQFKRDDWNFLLKQAFILENDELNNDDTTGVDYDTDDEDNDKFSGHILVYSRKFLSTKSLLSQMYSFTGIVYISTPFIEYGIYKIKGEVVDWLHVLPVWSPLDVSAFGYAATIIAEIIASVYCVSVHIVFDSFATGTMIFVCGQFSLLHAYSQRIGGSGKQFNLCQERDARAHYRIKKCHFIHVTLLRMVKQLDEIIRNIVGIYFFVATLTLCCVCIQLQSKDLSATQLISLLQYMCATLTQLFLYCHYGDAVQNESVVTLGEGPFASAWWSLGIKIRSEVGILCIRMSRCCKLFAGPFNVLNLESFIQIVRTAYSYYAVLRQTSE